MTTKTDLLAAMQTEAKALRARIAELRDQRDALVHSIDRVLPLFDAACNYGNGNPTSGADALHRELATYRDRLARGEDERKAAEQRLADIDRTLSADAAAATATKAVEVARQAVAAVEKKATTATAAAARWQGLAAEAFAASQQARATMIEIARHGLPEDVRAELGIVGVAPAAPAIDPATLEQRGVGFAEAAEKAQTQADDFSGELVTARDAEEQAVVELLRQRAYQAEVEHAVALASYLPVLARFRAAHDVAFGYAPDLPDYRRHADESHGGAMEAARQAALPQIEPGLMSRVKAAVRSLA